MSIVSEILEGKDIRKVICSSIFKEESGLIKGVNSVQGLFDNLYDFFDNTKDVKIRIAYCEEFERKLKKFKSNKKVILSEDDFEELGRKQLRSKIYDTIYAKHKIGDILVCSAKTSSGSNVGVDYVYYDSGWIDIGYLYNVAKYAMRLYDVLDSELVAPYENIEYLLNDGELYSVLLYTS